jgi:hypothetical protein
MTLKTRIAAYGVYVAIIIRVALLITVYQQGW